MPSVTQRRNRAYLNPLIERPAAWTGLAIDLDGSLERRFRPAGFAGRICVQLKLLSAAEPKGWSLRSARNYRRDLCGLTVELSGAHADV
jgi:hypothetical protein